MDDHRARILEILASLTNPTVIELGAYIGDDTAKLRAACRGDATYIAAEPDIRHLDALYRVPEIHVLPWAIAAFTGTCPFHLSADNHPCSSSILPPKLHRRVYPQVLFDRKETVRCSSLDSIAALFGITHVDLLWADIQGAEKDMVLGGRRTLERTDWMFVESYRTEMYEGQATRDEFLAMLPGWEVVSEDDEDVLMRRKNA